MIKRRAGAVLLAAAAMVLACLRERGGSGGAVWADPGAPSSLAAGLAILAFWFLAAFRAGRAAARRIDPGGTGASAILWTSFHAYLFVIVSVLCAGALGQINSIFLTVLAAAAFIVFGERSGRDGFAREETCGGDAAGEPGAGSGAEKPGIRGAVRRHPVAALIVAAAAGLALANAAWAFILPPFAHDDFTYHLVFPVEWAQSGTLSMKAVPFGNHSPPYYPMNTEMFYLWLFLPFREAFHINAAQVFFLGLSGLALFEIFKRCGASTRAALTAAVLMSFSPVAVAEAGKAYVDVAFCAFFLTALNAALAFHGSPSGLKALQFAAAVGAFAGTKIPGIVLSVLILLPLFAVVLYQADRRAKVEPAALTGARTARPRTGTVLMILAAAAGVFLAAGGWWYVRNLIVTGNPVFPLDVNVFGATLFQGAYGREALPPSRLATLLDLFTPPVLAVLAAGALVTAGALLAARRGRTLSHPDECAAGGAPRARPGPALVVGVLLPAVLAVVFRFLLPFDYARFVLALCGLAGAAILVPLDGNPKLRRTAGIAIAAALAASLAIGSWREKLLLPLLEPRLESSALVWGAFVLGIVVPAWLGLLMLVKARPLVRAAGAACAAVLVFILFWAGSTVADPAGDHFAGNFRKSREAYVHLQREFRGVTVAVAGTNRSFLLYGREFSNRVAYVNVNRCRGWMLHDFVRAYKGDRTALRGDRNAVGYYRRDARYQAWEANLEAVGADILFVERLTPYNLQKDYARDPQGFPLESIWAERHPEKFRKVFDSPVARIYEITGSLR